MFQKSYDDSPTLYLIPTPIGNLDDMTFRAVKVLNEVAVIFCEDTRVSRKLLDHFEIDKKLISLNDHSEEKKVEEVLEYLRDGNSVALISDAGSPTICDPGYKLVNKVVENNFNVVALPGATAFVPALSVSGLIPYPFIFIGFLNSKGTIKKIELEKYKDYEYTLVFYETPHRIEKTVVDMLNILGNRKISISREISKMYEEVYRGSISQYIESDKTIKGEMVVVVEGKKEELGNIDFISQIDKLVGNGTSKKKAIEKISKEFNVSRREVYNKYHRGE